MFNKFNDAYKLFLEEISKNFKYEGISLAIVPGSFKPPHKGHWEMITEYLKIVDKVIILISNISSKANLSKILSGRNLRNVESLIEYYKQYNLNIPEVDDIINEIQMNINTFTINDILKKLNEILIIKNSDVNFLNFCKIVNKTVKQINNSIFASIRKTSNNSEITPEMSKEIFEIFIKASNLEDRVEVRISPDNSPMKTAFKIINECDNCKIYLGVSNKGNDSSRFKIDNERSNEHTNDLIVYPIDVKTMMSATDIRNEIDNLKKEWFPDILSMDDFKRIELILSGN